MHQHVRVVLKIPAHKLLYYYEGEVDTVAAETADGRIIHFPANILRSIVSAIDYNPRSPGFHCWETCAKLSTYLDF